VGTGFGETVLGAMIPSGLGEEDVPLEAMEVGDGLLLIIAVDGVIEVEGVTSVDGGIEVGGVTAVDGAVDGVIVVDGVIAVDGVTIVDGVTVVDGVELLTEGAIFDAGTTDGDFDDLVGDVDGTGTTGGDTLLGGVVAGDEADVALGDGTAFEGEDIGDDVMILHGDGAVLPPT